MTSQIQKKLVLAAAVVAMGLMFATPSQADEHHPGHHHHGHHHHHHGHHHHHDHK